jgi:hypothetical protein
VLHTVCSSMNMYVVVPTARYSPVHCTCRTYYSTVRRLAFCRASSDLNVKEENFRSKVVVDGWRGVGFTGSVSNSIV